MDDSSSEFYKSILDHLYDGVYFVDKDRHITYWNQGAQRITGFNPERVIGKRCADNLLMHADDEGTILCTSGCPLAQTITDGQVREAQVYLRHADGHRVPVLIRVSPLQDEQGQIIGAVETFSDNSSMIAALKRVKELRSQVMLDPLTGIGNRRFIELKIETSLLECQHHQMTTGVVFIDIDHFKQINDDFGHDVGDVVLKMVANTIRYNIRSSDFLGRWGGEEFIVLLLDVDEKQITAVANKLCALVARSHLDVADTRIGVTISIGATLIRPDDIRETLLQRVDRLLYESKAHGRNRITFS
jgi:diguanylate cyclase (GGDEF)-like protein/PAS domain S-box-containing protein